MAELLNFVVWLPVAGMLAIALIPASQENMVRQLTLWLMIVQFVATAVLYVNFDSSATGLQFETRVPWIESWGVSYHIGLDGINILLVMLTAFLGPLVVALHYKDFAIEETPLGFRFTMVPLGAGSLNLPEITRRLHRGDCAPSRGRGLPAGGEPTALLRRRALRAAARRGAGARTRLGRGARPRRTEPLTGSEGPCADATAARRRRPGGSCRSDGTTHASRRAGEMRGRRGRGAEPSRR